MLDKLKNESIHSNYDISNAKPKTHCHKRNGQKEMWIYISFCSLEIELWLRNELES